MNTPISNSQMLSIAAKNVSDCRPDELEATLDFLARVYVADRTKTLAEIMTELGVS
jgi:hypothetical protein